MASHPSEVGGHGLEIDYNGSSIETLMGNKQETNGIGVLGSNVVEGSRKDERRDQNQDGDVDQRKEKERDSVVDGKNVQKDDSFFAKETNVNKETDGDLGSVAQEGNQKSKLEEEKQNVQVGEEKQLDNGQRARYCCVIQEEKPGFSVDELVWGKVKGHPWWPGQIFDVRYASDMALKRQKKDHFLIVYSGDKTFAWVPASQLKPLQVHFSELVKQSSMDPFVNAVDAILEEVSRRVELGMACHCLADEAYADLKYRKVENAGIREGTCSSAVDRSVFVSAFQPESILEYVCVLAQCPLEGFDRLDLTIATAYLKTFYRSKGYPELPLFVFADGLVDNDAEVPLSKGKVSGVVKADRSTPVTSSMTSGKRPRGRLPKKQFLEDDYEQKGQSNPKEEKDVHYLASSTAVPSSIMSEKRPRRRPRKNYLSEDSSEQTEEDGVDYPSRATGKKRKVVDSKSDVVGITKKGRVIKDVDSDYDYDAPSSTRSKSLRVGDRISRIAGQLKKSPAISRKHDDLSSKCAEKNETSAPEYSSPSKMLAQLCLVAIDPMTEYSFLPMTVGFFTKVRAYLSSMTSKDLETDKSMGRKRGRKKKVDYHEPDSSEMSESDYMQDSYWADIILQSSPEREPVLGGRKRKGTSKKKGQKKKIKPDEESLPYALLDAEDIQLVGASNPSEKQEMKGEIIGNTEEKLKAEEPTVLILSFNESDAVPSAAELNKIFSPYGPLREEETEVLSKTNRAKIVFRYRHDAEKAFSSTGKYSVFGPALVSYRLKYSPSPKSSPAASPQDNNDASNTKDEFQAQEGTEADVDDI